MKNEIHINELSPYDSGLIAGEKGDIHPYNPDVNSDSYDSWLDGYWEGLRNYNKSILAKAKLSKFKKYYLISLSILTGFAIFLFLCELLKI